MSVKPLTAGELRAILAAHPDELPVMAEVTTAAMDLHLAVRAYLVDRSRGDQALRRAADAAGGSAWVHGVERFDLDQADGSDGLLLLTE